MLQIDLNCDLGESYGRYRIGMDEQIIPIVSSVNIACGYHAGDPTVMRKTVEIAAAHGVSIGAHPGFPDLQGFGRRRMDIGPEDLTNMLVYQIGALQAFVKSSGLTLNHVKPHGALYNMAAVNRETARAIIKAVQMVDPNIILVGLAGSVLVTEGLKCGLKVASEVFADRTYRADGTLTPRGTPDAYIHDPEEAADRLTELISTGCIRAADGTLLKVSADTVCVHGDNEKAVQFALALRERMESAGVAIKPMSF
ncbi:MAG: LamB/YcsF family protein [Peptococcaceae bacterium]|nr:LamB/YcsF family protein [Peptococcaceae bacterium]